MATVNPTIFQRDVFAVLCCHGCRQPLGVTTASMLVLGTARVRRAVTLECSGCHATITWRPAHAGEDFDGEYRR